MRDAWRRCREGSIRFVIGSRSALFSPLPDLGLIIIDEEHEWTYKNEQSPRYHAVRVAEQWNNGTMEQYENVKLVLGTATPSVDSWYRAQIGDYQLVELPERYGGAQLPSVQVVDLAQIEFGKHYPLSPTLINAVRTRLDKNEQSVLFLNRRGFATSLLCMNCRTRFEDPETHLPYTVHYRGAHPYLLSHHTGEELEIPAKCPHCQSPNLRSVGAGTQRIESILEDLFPSARILRADADTLKSPEQMRTLLNKMHEGRADILLGTQSVVKGLDLPNVTLAAVLLADVGLSLPHFRAGERVFQLLTQLTGRSGRAKPGEVIIQTFRPNAVEVTLAAAHDVRSYLERELAERKKVHYPPDTQMVRVVFSGPDSQKRAKEFVALFQRRGPEGPEGPEGRGVEKPFVISQSPSLFSRSTWYVFIRGSGKHVREVLKGLPPFEGVVDIDPVECL
jgi:primosomal protein N' (replication factor Y) (superfamily II helicase)